MKINKKPLRAAANQQNKDTVNTQAKTLIFLPLQLEEVFQVQVYNLV
jgi:hypothetical protein